MSIDLPADVAATVLQSQAIFYAMKRLAVSCIDTNSEMIEKRRNKLIEMCRLNPEMAKLAQFRRDYEDKAAR